MADSGDACHDRPGLAAHLSTQRRVHWWPIQPPRADTPPISTRRAYVEVLALFAAFFASAIAAAAFSLAGNSTRLGGSSAGPTRCRGRSTRSPSPDLRELEGHPLPVRRQRSYRRMRELSNERSSNRRLTSHVIALHNDDARFMVSSSKAARRAAK